MDLAVPELREEHPAPGVYKAARLVARDRRVVVAAQGPIDGARRRTAQRLVGCDFAIVAVARCGNCLADAVDDWLEEIRERIGYILKKRELRHEVAGVGQRRADGGRHECCSCILVGLL